LFITSVAFMWLKFVLCSEYDLLSARVQQKLATSATRIVHSESGTHGRVVVQFYEHETVHHGYLNHYITMPRNIIARAF